MTAVLRGLMRPRMLRSRRRRRRARIQLVGAVSQGQASGLSIDVAYPPDVEDGDLLLAWLTHASSLTRNVWTPPAGWASIGGRIDCAEHSSELFQRVAASETGSAVWANSVDNDCRAVALAYRGVDQVAPVEASDTAAVTAQTAPLTLTTLGLRRLLVAFASNDVTPAAGAGFSSDLPIELLDDNLTPNGLAAAAFSDLVVPGGQVDRAVSWSTGGVSLCAALVAIVPEAS